MNNSAFWHIMSNYTKKVYIARCKNCKYCQLEFDELGRFRPFADCCDPYGYHNTCVIHFACENFVPRSGYTLVRNSNQLSLFSSNDVDNLSLDYHD